MNWPAFYAAVFRTGDAVLTDRPDGSAGPDAETAELFRERFRQHRAGVAGPLIDIDMASACGAAKFTALACWFLVSRDEPAEELDRLLAPPPAPRAPAEHLSADLTLRYAVAVHRRAEALHPDDALTGRLRAVLRAFPLTGALANRLDPPTGDTAFGGHYGLQLLFAERLLAHDKPDWLPTAGPTREAAELVFRQAGRKLPVTRPSAG